MLEGWPKILAAAISGGAILKIAEYLIELGKYHRKTKKAAKEVVDSHLDPLLKSADEIHGKTCSLADRDFEAFKAEIENGVEAPRNTESIGLLYLYAKLWGRIEILRNDSLGVQLSADKRGDLLKKLLACLESKQIRLVDRLHQKAIGEIATKATSDGKLASLGLVEFTEKLKSSPSYAEWTKPLTDLLANAHDKKQRQKLLTYGVVLHVFIDQLDPKHNSSHPRPPYPNKLTESSKKTIKYTVFDRYLKDSTRTLKYIGSRKKEEPPQIVSP